MENIKEENAFPDFMESIAEMSKGRVAVCKKINPISFAVLAVGVLSFIVRTSMSMSESADMSLLLTGITGVIGGLIWIFVRKTAFTIDGKKAVLKELSFDNNMFDRVSALFNSGNYKELENIKTDSASLMKILVLYSSESKSAYSQLMRFVPYRFQPASAIKNHEASDAAQLIDLVKNQK